MNNFGGGDHAKKQLLTVNLLTPLIKIKLGLLEGNPSFLFYPLIK